jgi:hypothetical protein
LVLADTFFWVNSTSPRHFLFYIPKAFRIEKRFGSGRLAIVDKKVVLLTVSAQLRRRGSTKTALRKSEVVLECGYFDISGSKSSMHIQLWK